MDNNNFSGRILAGIKDFLYLVMCCLPVSVCVFQSFGKVSSIIIELSCYCFLLKMQSGTSKVE